MRNVAVALALSAVLAAPGLPEPTEAEPGSRKRGKGKVFKREPHEATKPKPKSESLKRLLGKKPRKGHSNG